MYAVHGDLVFQTNPDDALSQVTLASPAVNLKYLPLVPTSFPHYPVIEMTQVMDPYSTRQLFKAAVESPQRGVCPGRLQPPLLPPPPRRLVLHHCCVQREDFLLVQMGAAQARSAWTFVVPLTYFVFFVLPTTESVLRCDHQCGRLLMTASFCSYQISDV